MSLVKFLDFLDDWTFVGQVRIEAIFKEVEFHAILGLDILCHVHLDIWTIVYGQKCYPWSLSNSI